ncbi:MAG: GAF domain-containing protein [Leptolyngbyaceae cyanobacterium bins.349]|nr:GAF domain-containing protein [Leptolyngbyaceae cyanobacterium bins.349]
MLPNFQARKALPRELSPLENLAFCCTGLLVWQLTVGLLNASLGASALWVWLPGVLIAMTLTLQVKHFGRYYPDVSGGTANYTARLLAHCPLVGAYAAIGYYISWVAGIAANALVLTSLIKIHTDAAGVACPELWLKVGFTVLPFILAFTGTRALALLHMVFMLPAIGFLLLFTLQGLSWLVVSPNRSEIPPISFPSLGGVEWFKWFFVASFTVFVSEGGSAFIADSREPRAALRSLSLTAWLVPVVYLGGSWVVARWSTDTTGDAFLTLLGAATPFWGASASAWVTLLIASAALLATTTTVAVVERNLYQLALDGYVAPMFGVASRRGVMAPALTITLVLSLGCLVWGDIAKLLAIANVGYLVAIASFHWGSWVNRDRPEVLWPRWSLACFGVETLALVIGGVAVGVQEFVLGLAVPAVLLMGDALIRRMALPIFQPGWWQNLSEVNLRRQLKDFLAVQVIVLIFLLIGATITGWFIKQVLVPQPHPVKTELLGVLVLVVTFVGVAISAWTSLPQVTAIAEARRQAEHLFTIAQDGIVVLDRYGLIRQINPAAAQLFAVNACDLLGHPLNQHLPNLVGLPQTWLHRSTQRVLEKDVVKTLEMSISEQNEPDELNYLVILRDVSDRVAAETMVRQQAERDRLLSEIALHMRQSLELNQILSTVVAAVRQFLQTDRVVIYQFRADWSSHVIVESVAQEWPSIAYRQIAATYFPENVRKAYRQGQIQTIEDVYAADLPERQLEFFTRLQIRAKLIVPIVQSDTLWGVLVAHHCRSTRGWQPTEIDFLKQLAMQTAIAIHQAELYRHEQRLNLILEQQVEERTAQLQQALRYEAVLKRITDKVRDSLDEEQILQTVVEELANQLQLYSCDTGLYDLSQEQSVICYEYVRAATDIPLSIGSVVAFDSFAEVYRQLLRGQDLQFCWLPTFVDVVRPTPRQYTILVCPIMDDQGVIGDLWLYRRQENFFENTEIRLVQQVANHCAIAVRQARLYQAAQVQVRALEELNQLKDDFLSTVSHELRTPIANMKMAIHMLKLSGDEQRRDRYIEILQTECTREADLINDLLDLQRLASGLKELDLEPIHLQAWLPAVIEPFRERTQNRQQVLQVYIPSDLPELTTDAVSLSRILAELLNNACKYTPPGQVIRVAIETDGPFKPAIAEQETRQRFPLLSLKPQTQSIAASEFLWIRVSNTGVEIPAQELSRIFEKFYRIPSIDRWKQGGTGLGLALVQKLIEHLGGTIQVESGSGQTCFHVKLPFSCR